MQKFSKKMNHEQTFQNKCYHFITFQNALEKCKNLSNETKSWEDFRKIDVFTSLPSETNRLT